MSTKISKEDLEQFVEKIAAEVQLVKKSAPIENLSNDVVSIHRGRVGRLDSFGQKAFTFKKNNLNAQQTNVNSESNIVVLKNSDKIK